VELLGLFRGTEGIGAVEGEDAFKGEPPGIAVTDFARSHKRLAAALTCSTFFGGRIKAESGSGIKLIFGVQPGPIPAPVDIPRREGRRRTRSSSPRKSRPRLQR